MVLQVHVAYGSEVPPLSAALSPDADSTQTRSTPNSSTLRGAAPAGARTVVAFDFDQTLTFVPKILVMLAVVVLLTPWIVQRLGDFASALLWVATP